MKSRTMSFFNRTLIACLSAGTILLPGLANAQLEEIVVTAQKREQNIQDVPLSVMAIGTEQLDNNQFRDIRQILAIAPSVNFQHGFTPAATNFNIRGLGTFAFVAGLQPGVALNIDGVPRARNGEFVFDLADIEQIEVLRGPQGTLFGRNSTGGAINIMTAGPTEEFEAEIEAGASDDEEYLVRAVVSGPLSDKVRGRVAAIYIDREGYLENLGPEGGHLGGQETLAMRGKLEFDLTDDVTVLFSGDYSDNDHGFNPLVGNLGTFLQGAGPGGTDRESFSTNFAYPADTQLRALGNGNPVLGQQILDDPFKVAQARHDDQENLIYGLGLDITWDYNENLRIKSITSWRRFTNDNANDTDATPADLTNLGLYPFIAISSTTIPRDPTYGFQDKLEYFQQELRLEGSHDRFDWILGGFYQSLDEHHTAGRAYLFDISAFVGAPFGSLYTCGVCDSANSTVDQETRAIFGDVTLHVNDKLDIFGGVRWTEEDVTKNLNGTFYAGAIDAATLLSLTDANQVADLNAVVGTALFANRPPANNGTANDTFDFWSFRVGTSYAFADALSTYFTFSRGNVGPGLPLTQTDVVVSVGDRAPFVDPTEADNYEIGFKSEFLDNRLRLNVAVFKMDVRGIQTQQTLPGTITPITIAAGNLDITGFELDASYAATDWLTLSAAVVHTDAEVEDVIVGCYEDQLTAGRVPGCTIDADGNGIPENQDISGTQTTNTPKWAYNLNAAFDISSESWPVNYYGSLNWSWRDDIQYELNQDHEAVQDSYGTLDFTVGLRDQQGRWEAYVYGKNVTDKYYFNYGVGIPTFIDRIDTMALRSSQAYFGGGVRLFF